MIPFTFIYQGKNCNGSFCTSTRGKGWFKVVFFGHSTVILPAIFDINENKKTWVQNIRQGESVWPHDLIQIMGESIEAVPNNEFSENQRSRRNRQVWDN